MNPPNLDVPVEDRDVTRTATTTVELADPGLRRFGRAMRVVGLLGVLAGLVAIAIGLWMVRDLDVVLGRSLALTSESLTTVDSSLAVAAGSLDVVRDGLGRAEQTSRGLEGSFVDGADLLDDAGTLLRGDVAASLEAVERSMPALVQVGGTIDSTLRAVGQLPIGLSYDPDEPFDQTLRALQRDLDGLPEDLRTQADTIDGAGENLRTVGRQGEAIAASIGDVRSSLDDAASVLRRYQTTAGQARDLLDQTIADLDRRLIVLRVLVVVLGLIFCAGQVLPLYLGHRLAAARATVTRIDGPS